MLTILFFALYYTPEDICCFGRLARQIIIICCSVSSLRFVYSIMRHAMQVSAGTFHAASFHAAADYAHFASTAPFISRRLTPCFCCALILPRDIFCFISLRFIITIITASVCRRIYVAAAFSHFDCAIREAAVVCRRHCYATRAIYTLATAVFHALRLSPAVER